LIADLCDQRNRSIELNFGERWRSEEERTYKFCQLAFITGVIFFFLLSVAVTYITSYNHPGRDAATIISGTVFVCTAGVIAPILLEEFQRSSNH
jgi:hypothetical protein